MTAIEWLKLLRKTVIFLLIWNLVLTFCLVSTHLEKQATELNQQICNLEEIPNDDVPQFEIVEVD